MRGYSLVELLVVISFFGVTLALVATSLHAILRTTTRFRDEEARAAMLLRLDLQFRTDVHLATRIESSASNSAGETEQLTMHRDDNLNVDYRIEGGRVYRLLSRQGTQVQRDAYTLGDHTHLRFETTGGLNEVSSVALLVEQVPDEQSPSSPSARMNAIRAAFSGIVR